MTWQLDPRASFCIASGRAIFLHAGQDRYLALPDPLNAALLAWLAAPQAEMPRAVAEPLAAAGLIVPAEGDARPVMPLACTAARQALPRPPRERVTLTDLASVAWTYWRTRRGLRRLGFAALLDALPGPVPLPAGDPVPHALRFLRARTLLSIDEECLIDSLALLDYLRRRGCGAQAVFGVTAVPFQAHCWVQSAQLLLNDAPDHVAAFTPILVR